MPKNVKRETIKLRTFVPEMGGVAKVEILLPAHFSANVRETVDGFALTLAYNEQSCVLRERKEGTIECEADWIHTRSGRQRTGTHNMKEAIEWAASRMIDAHAEHLKRGVDEDGKPAATPSTLRLSEADLLLRSDNLLPGKRGSKKQAPYDLALCIARTVWTEDPILSEINQTHIDRIYKARLRPEHWEEVFDDDPPADLKPFEWPPAYAGRRRAGRVKPVTIQGDLSDLATALDALVGRANETGGVYLKYNPLSTLKLGSYEKDRGDEAGPKRYPAVIRSADDAIELLRTRGRRWKERRLYDNNGEEDWRTYNRSEKLDYAPGFLRMAMVIQFGHPTRPASWRHLQIDDCARTRSQLVRLITSLKLRKSDHSIPLSYADVWVHGGIRYRRKYSKLARERLVPLSPEMKAELTRYLKKRAQWLRRRAKDDKQEQILESPWLFPSPRDPMQSLSERDQNRLIGFGESVARERVQAAGLDADEIVPDLRGEAWYPYRRWWKTIRNAIGWEGNSNAAYIGDWSIKTGATADVVYARLSPHLILACVEGKSLVEAIADDPGTQAYQEAARISPDVGEEARRDGENVPGRTQVSTQAQP